MLASKTKYILIGIAALIGLSLLATLISNNPFSRPQTKVDLSRASVVKEIQSLGNLETASFTIEKIVEAGQQGNVFQDILYGDRILLIANGKVIAGVNLNQINKDNVSVNGDRLSVTLPAPVILNSSLDNSKTTVYDRTQGFLNRGSKNLETEARTSAEASIRQGACDAGILIEARDNAIVRIKQLFQFVGFTTVDVIIPQGSC